MTATVRSSLGFRPAFYDFATSRIYPARFADGTYASHHVLDGLPDEVVFARWADGRAMRVKPTLIAGFERGGYFYTRTAALRAAGQWIAR